jgi:hypothetical protein
MVELTPLERFQVAVEVAGNYYYDFFYAQDCWELGFICPCMNGDYDEVQNPEDYDENEDYGGCGGYWFIDLHTDIPFKSWDDKVCSAIAGEFTKWSYFEDCTCDEDDEDDEQYYEWDDSLSEEDNRKAEGKWDKDHPEKVSGQEKFQQEVDKVFEKAIAKAEKKKDKLGYYPIKLDNDRKGIPESQVKGYKEPK